MAITRSQFSIILYHLPLARAFLLRLLLPFLLARQVLMDPLEWASILGEAMDPRLLHSLLNWGWDLSEAMPHGDRLNRLLDNIVLTPMIPAYRCFSSPISIPCLSLITIIVSMIMGKHPMMM